MTRRALARWDALAVGGPLAGLRLAVDEMSDGGFKIVGGKMFGDDLAGYVLDAPARRLVYAGGSS